MIASTVQYLFTSLSSWKDFEKKIQNNVEIAHQKDSDLLLFPEYFSLELCSLFPSGSLAAQFDELQKYLPPFLELFKKLAAKYQIYLCAGTFPTKVGAKYRNRSYLFTPSGKMGYQDKLQLTQYEQKCSFIESGDTIKVFQTKDAVIGIAVCYDSEFPPICRNQIEAAAELLLVPSCTDSEAGFYRVHISSRARAIENQCFVLTATTLGAAPWSEAVDLNVGSCGIFSPVDLGFPSDGILSKGEDKDKHEICHAELNFSALKNVRENGNVLNHQDWKFLPQILSKKTVKIEL